MTMMGDVGRILYVHVPTAWVALLTYLIAFVVGIGSLWTGKKGWDATLEASLEVGVLLNIMLTIQGSVWAKPTWGIWWTWDPRLTTTAIMVLSFIGVILLRQLITNAQKRATYTAVCASVAIVNVPFVYMSVKWWRTLHQDSHQIRFPHQWFYHCDRSIWDVVLNDRHDFDAAEDCFTNG